MNSEPIQPELSPAPSGESREIAVLRGELSALRTHLNLLLLVVLLTGMPVAAYLMKQSGMVRRQAEATEAQHAKTLAEFEKTYRPAAAGFVQKLIEYSQLHPDYAPILSKNGVTMATNSAGAATTPAPAPAAQKE